MTTISRPLCPPFVVGVDFFIREAVCARFALGLGDPVRTVLSAATTVRPLPRCKRHVIFFYSQ
ncbi:MAG: hypothetical protein WA709_24525 [Stellaceae bacterium]